MTNHLTGKVSTKVTAATAGAMLGEIIVWFLETVLELQSVPSAAFTVLGAFALGWLVPERNL